jgi:hypothetical protein
MLTEEDRYLWLPSVLPERPLDGILPHQLGAVFSTAEILLQTLVPEETGKQFAAILAEKENEGDRMTPLEIQQARRMGEKIARERTAKLFNQVALAISPTGGRS